MREEIKNIKGTKKELKKFGITMAIVLCLFGVLFLWRQKNYYVHCFVFSGIFLTSGLLFPILLKPVYKIWMTLALILGYIMTRVILSILFYFMLTPLSLISRIFGKQCLDVKIEKDKKSYWNYRDIKEFNKLDYEKQF